MDLKGKELEWRSTPPSAAPAAQPVAHVVLTFRAFWDEFAYVAECMELDVSSFGASLEEAFSAALEATVAYLDALEDEGVREQVFAEKGIPLYLGAPGDDFEFKVIAHPNEYVSPQRLSALAPAG